MEAGQLAKFAAGNVHSERSVCIDDLRLSLYTAADTHEPEREGVWRCRDYAQGKSEHIYNVPSC